jgi:type IV pilus assembly protein PilM
MPDEELEGQVRLAAEQYIPFDINEVNIDFHVLPSDPSAEKQGDMEVILVAAKKDKINELTELVKGAGLQPMIMDVDAFAIENMHAINYPMAQDETTALINIGASVMNVNIVRAGASLFTRDIPLGGNRYTEAIQREMGMSYEEAEENKKAKQGGDSGAGSLSNVMNGVSMEVAAEIARTVEYFKASTANVELDRMLVCGGVAQAKGLTQQLGERMQVPVEVADPFVEIDVTGSDMDPGLLAELASSAAVGVGLALRAVGDR